MDQNIGKESGRIKICNFILIHQTTHKNSADISVSKYFIINPRHFDELKYYPIKKNSYTTIIEINLKWNYLNKQRPANTFNFAGDREQADH